MNTYIHIPFCKQKCNYCSFVSYPLLEKKTEYLCALKKEIEHYYKGEYLETIYFGGGTPSLLTVDEIKSLLSHFNFDKNSEITLEINPETVDLEYMKSLYKTGVNRVSIGCQTFDDDILKLIGRKHSAKDVENCVDYAKKAGFKNISLDFIYGLPNQTVESFEKDLRHAKSLNVNHISLYGLKIDKGCYFYDNRPKTIADEDLQADMYLKAVKILDNHYEISNFGTPSRHNLNYWNNKNYYGFGCAAHGYLKNVRYSNFADLDKYINNPLRHENEIELTQKEQLEEEIFLGLRKLDGIDVLQINKKFGIDFEKKYVQILKKYENYFKKTKNGYALTVEGILISNNILSEFI